MELILAAAVGAKALWFLYAWLGSAILCAELAKRKGFTEKIGLGTGLLLPVLGAIAWVAIRPKPGSPWVLRQQRKAANR